MTEKTVKKKGKKGKMVTKVEKTDSFFRFFNDPQEEADEDDEDGEDDLYGLIDADFETGITIKDKLVPNAIRWFTGEALEDEDDDDEDEEDGDDDDEDDDEDDGALWCVYHVHMWCTASLCLRLVLFVHVVPGIILPGVPV